MIRKQNGKATGVRLHGVMSNELVFKENFQFSTFNFQCSILEKVLIWKLSIKKVKREPWKVGPHRNDLVSRLTSHLQRDRSINDPTPSLIKHIITKPYQGADDNDEEEDPYEFITPGDGHPGTQHAAEGIGRRHGKRNRPDDFAFNGE